MADPATQRAEIAAPYAVGAITKLRAEVASWSQLAKDFACSDPRYALRCEKEAEFYTKSADAVDALLAECSRLTARVEELEAAFDTQMEITQKKNQRIEILTAENDRLEREIAGIVNRHERVCDSRARLAEDLDAALNAHAASFGALQAISMLTPLNGEVDDYADVTKAVERLTAENAALTRDAERLDWIFAHLYYGTLEVELNHRLGQCITISKPTREIIDKVRGLTQEAIDAARASLQSPAGASE